MAVLKGKVAEFNRGRNERAWLAWHIAALHRSKKMIPLRKLLVRDRRPQSWQQMQAIAKQWVALSGGSSTSN